MNFSRTEFPPGGWQFYQPQSGWAPPSPKGSTFDQTVQLIIKHRMQNPALIVRHRWSTDPVAVGNELEDFTRARLGMPGRNQRPAGSPPPPMPVFAGPIQQAVFTVKKLAAATGLMLSWENSGLPGLEKTVADANGNICSQCPFNGAGQTVFAVPAPRPLPRLESLGLSTTVDGNLKTCAATLCQLKYAVHMPKEIWAKLKPEYRAELHPSCWIPTLQ